MSDDRYDHCVRIKPHFAPGGDVECWIARVELAAHVGTNTSFDVGDDEPPREAYYRAKAWAEGVLEGAMKV